MNKYLKLGKLAELKTYQPEQLFKIYNKVAKTKEFNDYVQNCTNFTNTEHDYLKNILEIQKNINGYYVDKYDQRVSYNGLRTLRKPKTELKLENLHDIELKKCEESFEYFRKHYVLITTKTGLDRPEPRKYQETLESSYLKITDTVVLFPRQSGKTITTAVYLLWQAIFHENQINIGIVANKPKTAREVLDKIKKIFLELPIWMKPGTAVWNKSEIEFENGTRIMTDSPSSDSFRGFTCNIIYVDEAAYIPKGNWDEFIDSIMPTMNSLIFKQVIISSTANGMNHFEKMVKQSKLPDSTDEFVSCSWRDVPHYDKRGNLLHPDEYKRLTIKKYGKKFFAQTEECVGGSTIINTKDGEYEIKDIYERDELFM